MARELSASVGRTQEACCGETQLALVAIGQQPERGGAQKRPSRRRSAQLVDRLVG